MKNNLKQKGFIVPVLLGIIALLIIGGGMYVYKIKKVDAPVIVNESEKAGSDNSQEIASVDTTIKNINTETGLKKFVREKYYFYAPSEWIEHSSVLTDSGKFTGCEIYSISYGGDGHRAGGIIGIYLNSCVELPKIPAGPIKENIKKDGYYIVSQYSEDNTPLEIIKTQEAYKKVVETFNLNQETMIIKVYFGDTIDAQSCHTPSYVERIIPKTTAVARASVEELLKGPTESEKLKDFWTGLRSGIVINSISVNNGVASLDLSTSAASSLNDPNKGACGASISIRQIEDTLKQFSTIKSVLITVNGGKQDSINP